MVSFDVGSTTRLWSTGLGSLLLGVGLVVLMGACRQPDSSVQSHLEGRVVVNSDAGSADDYGDFRVLVLRPDGRQVDTLGYASTDQDGHFRMTITAPRRGIYSLSLWDRTGRKPLASADYVVAPGDSATLRVELPLGQRSLQPESPENSVLRRYRNAMGMHRRMLTRRLQTDGYDLNTLAQNVRLTSSILWSLRDRFPHTYVGEFAAVESLSFLEGWNDSLVVARTRQIDPSSPQYADAVRIARRAVARRHGHRAALNLLDTLEAQAPSPLAQAEIKAARIQAFLDSTQVEAALSAAQRLRAEHSQSQWAEWAGRIQHEANRLQPGMTAPNLTLHTLDGDTLSLRSLRGYPVVLEYYRPGTDLYKLKHPLRNALHEATRSDSVAFVSVSLEPDSLANRVFLQNQPLPGHNVIAPRGTEDPLATQYNVVHLPTWILIDRAGKIVDQYQASAFPALRQHLIELLVDRSAEFRTSTR